VRIARDGTRTYASVPLPVGLEIHAGARPSCPPAVVSLPDIPATLLPGLGAATG